MWIQCAKLGARLDWEDVPSKRNIADGPSRASYATVQHVSPSHVAMDSVGI